MFEIGDKEDAIKRVVLHALEVGENAAAKAAANAQELGADAQVAEKVVRTIWKAVKEGEVVDYIWDVLEAMRRRGEY